ncbi:unnamed protein product [Rotaria sp. Silwood1]|nr:unnamed protein product [Rotaria sp. Silwood1]
MIHIEHLPVEILLLIFSYLEAYDLFQAFGNLNNYFNQLLASDSLSLNIELKHNDENHCRHSTSLFQSDSIIRRITFIKWIDTYRRGYCVQLIDNNIHKLIRLRSLTIGINRRYSWIFCRILYHLSSSLEYLSIKTAVPTK